MFLLCILVGTYSNCVRYFSGSINGVYTVYFCTINGGMIWTMVGDEVGETMKKLVTEFFGSQGSESRGIRVVEYKKV